MTSTTLHKVKQSFTIEATLLKELSGFKNKSQVVNTALGLYFERAKYVEIAEEQFWTEKIQQWMLDIQNWDVTVVNPGGWKVTREMLSKALWS